MEGTCKLHSCWFILGFRHIVLFWHQLIFSTGDTLVNNSKAMHVPRNENKPSLYLFSPNISTCDDEPAHTQRQLELCFCYISMYYYSVCTYRTVVVKARSRKQIKIVFVVTGEFTSLSVSHRKNTAMQTQNMPHIEETLDIIANVLWEPVTKTVHPKHN